MFFLSCFCEFFWGALIFSEDRQLHAAAANRETRVNSTRFSRLWRKQLQKSTPTEKSVRSADTDLAIRTSLVPRRKA